MTRSNKTFGNFIWQSQKNPITFVEYSIRRMNLKMQIIVQTPACHPACCCMICCMP